MKITELKNNPPLLIFLVFLLIAVIGLTPIKEHLGFSNFASDKLEGIILPSIFIFILIAIISKLRIPHSYFALIHLRDYIYYLPAIIYIFIFTGGFQDSFRVNFSTLYSGKLLLYGIEALTRALFEEILFRGMVFGILLNKYYDSKKGIFKSLIISSLLFGLAHIVNIWSQPQISARGTLNQVYAATCLGAMYCAIYLKTRSIIVLSILHFVSNIFAGIGELASSEIIVEAVSGDRTIMEIIASNVLTFVIFGSSLLIGLYILTKTKREEVEEFIGLG